MIIPNHSEDLNFIRVFSCDLKNLLLNITVVERVDKYCILTVGIQKIQKFNCRLFPSSYLIAVRFGESADVLERILLSFSSYLRAFLFFCFCFRQIQFAVEEKIAVFGLSVLLHYILSAYNCNAVLCFHGFLSSSVLHALKTFWRQAFAFRQKKTRRITCMCPTEKNYLVGCRFSPFSF